MSQPIDTASVAIVPDFSDFSSQAKRGVDEGLRQVAAAAERAFERVERSAAEAGREVGSELRAGGAIAEGAIREVGTQSQIMAAKVSASANVAGSALGSKISAGALAAKAGLAALAFGVTAGLGALTAFGLKSAAALEQTQIGIEALLGSAEDAKTFIGELQQFAAKTPFEFAGVADASRRVLAFGEAVGITRDEVIPTLTTIGDLVSVLGGTQENIDGILRAFGQIASKGRLMGGEILQISEQLPGFNVNQAIAAKLGVSVAEALRLQEAGAIDAQTAIEGLLEGMANFKGAAGAMEKQAGTLLGVFSTFKDTISIALTQAFQPVIPEIKQSLADITPILGEAIGQLAPLLGKLLSTVLPIVADLISALVPILNPIIDAISSTLEALRPALQPLGDALGKVVAAFTPLLPILGEVVTELVLALVPVIEELAPLFAELVGPIGDILKAVLPLIPPLGELLVLFVKSQTPLIQLVAAIQSFVTNKAVAPFIEDLAEALQIVVDLARPVIEFSDSLDKMGDNLSFLGSFSLDGLKAIGEFFQNLPGQVMGFLQDLPGRLVQWATTSLSNVAFAVGFGIGRVIRFFAELPAQVIAAVTALPGQLSAFFTAAFETARVAVVTKFNQLVAFVRGIPAQVIGALRTLPGRIATFASELGPKAVQVGRDIVAGIIRGITQTIGGVGSALKRGIDSGIAGLKSGLGISSPSKVMAREVGRWLPPGIEQGVQQGMPGLLATITGLVGDISAITGRGSPSSSLTVDVGGVVVNGSGTVADATSVGDTVGRSVLSAARRAQVALAVRMR